MQRLVSPTRTTMVSSMSAIRLIIRRSGERPVARIARRDRGRFRAHVAERRRWGHAFVGRRGSARWVVPCSRVVDPSRVCERPWCAPRHATGQSPVDAMKRRVFGSAGRFPAGASIFPSLGDCRGRKPLVYYRGAEMCDAARPIAPPASVAGPNAADRAGWLRDDPRDDRR